MNASKTYFITGGTGFIGRHLVHQLIDAGHRVRLLVRTPAKAEALARKGAELVAGDITEKESMRAGMAGVDGVFHIAAWYTIGRKNPLADRINVDGTRKVLELLVPLPPAYTAEGLRAAAASYVATNEKARRELGYAPRLRETLEHEMRLLGSRPRPR